MRTHTNNYKSEISKMGRQLDAIITCTIDDSELELGKEELNSIKTITESNLFKSVMKEIDLDSNIDIPLETEINAQIGVLVGNTYEYVNYGNYIVYSSEYNADTLSYKIVAYDKMLYSMVEASDNFLTNLTYPITVKNYLTAICEQINLTLTSTIFINDDTLINQSIHNGIGYTYRDILDDISQVTGSNICLNNNDEVIVKYPTETNEVIDEEMLKDINVVMGEKVKFNALVFSRSTDSDTINRRDEELIQQDGLQEIKIKDNQILSTNDRDMFIDELWDYLDGFEYYICDYSSTGITYLEVGDKYTISIDSNLYPTIMINSEMTYEQGLSENVYVDAPIQSETNYKTSNTTDKLILQTNLIVDKQIGQIQGTVANINGQIDTLATNDETMQGTLNQFTLDLDGFRIDLQNNTESINNMGFDFSTGGLTVTKDNAKVKSTLDNEGVSVYDTNDTLQAIFNNNGSGVDKLIVTGTAQLGYLKFTKGYKNNKKVTQIFHLENLIEDLEDLRNEEGE